MTITIRPDLEIELRERPKAGGYGSPDEMVNTVLEQFMDDDFEPGEMDALLSAGRPTAADQLVEEGEVRDQLKQWRQPDRLFPLSRYPGRGPGWG